MLIGKTLARIYEIFTFALSVLHFNFLGFAGTSGLFIFIVSRPEIVVIELFVDLMVPLLTVT